jgi:hypothetical protein
MADDAFEILFTMARFVIPNNKITKHNKPKPVFIFAMTEKFLILFINFTFLLSNKVRNKRLIVRTKEVAVATSLVDSANARRIESEKHLSSGGYQKSN